MNAKKCKVLRKETIKMFGEFEPSTERKYHAVNRKEYVNKAKKTLYVTQTFVNAGSRNTYQTTKRRLVREGAYGIH